MPYQTVKDPTTGEEYTVYVAPAKAEPTPQAAAPAPAAQKQPAPPQMLGGAGAAQVAYDLLGSVPGFGAQLQSSRTLSEAFSRGLKTYQQTGNVLQSLQQGLGQANKPATPPLFQRMVTNAVRNTVQEATDTVVDLFGAGTTPDRPNTPLPGPINALFPKYEAKLGPFEELSTGLLQAGIQLMGLSRAQGLGLQGLASSKAPGVAAVGQKLQKVEAGISGLQAAPIKGQVLKGLAQRGAGYYLEGAGKGAIIDFAGFDQYGGNVSDVVTNLVQSVAGTDVELPIVEYLRSKPGEAGAKARLRNALDGFAWGGPIGMAFGVGAAGFKNSSNLLTKTIEYVKAIQDEADVIREAQKATAAPAKEAAAAPAPGTATGTPNAKVDAAQLQARVQAAEQQVRRYQTQLDALGAEPERPLTGEKSDRAKAYRSYVRERNQLQKGLAAAQAELSNIVMEPGVSKAPAPKGVTGKPDLRATRTEGKPDPEAAVPQTIEEAVARREAAEQELTAAWTQAKQGLDEQAAAIPPEPVAEAPAATPTPMAQPAAAKVPGVDLDPSLDKARMAYVLGNMSGGKGLLGIKEAQWQTTFERLGGVPNFLTLSGGQANWEKLQQGFEMPELEAKIKGLVQEPAAVAPSAAPIAARERQTAAVEIPAAASKKITAKTSEGRIETAASSLASWTTKAGGQPMSMDEAINLVRSKGSILDPDKIPGLDMETARADKTKGVIDTPATNAVAAVYRQYYGLEGLPEGMPDMPIKATTPALEQPAPEAAISAPVGTDVESRVAALGPEPEPPQPPQLIAGRKTVASGDTRGQGVYFHGSAQAIPGDVPRSVESGDYWTDTNIFGNGFYTTDDFVTSGRYTQKGKAAALKPQLAMPELREYAGEPLVRLLQDAGATRDEINALGFIAGKELPAPDRLYEIAQTLEDQAFAGARPEERTVLQAWLDGTEGDALVEVYNKAYDETLPRRRFNEETGEAYVEPRQLDDSARRNVQFLLADTRSGAKYGNIENASRVSKRLQELADNPPQKPEYDPVIYLTKERTPVKFFDADREIPWTENSPEANALRASGGSFWDEVLGDWEANGSMSYGEMLDTLRTGNADISAAELTLVMDELNGQLSRLGYGGLTHEGGRRAGQGIRTHSVRIYWDAENQLTVKKIKPGIKGVDPEVRGEYEAQLKAYNDYWAQRDAIEAEAAAPVSQGGAPQSPPSPEMTAAATEIDQSLAVARADLNLEQRVALRNQILAEQQAAAAEQGVAPEALDAAMPPPPTESPAMPKPDLEAVVSSASEKLDDLRAGKISLEDLMQNEVRRYISPSGNTIYKPNTPEELAAFVQAISDTVVKPLGMNLSDMHRQAAHRARIDGFGDEQMEQLIGRAQDYVEAGSDVAEKVVFVRSMQLAVDHFGNEAAVLAVKWKNSGGSDAALARQLIAAYDTLSRVYVPYMALGRQAAQEMRGRQMKQPFDSGLLSMPKGTELMHGTTAEAGASILENGFKPSSRGGSLLGEGVYFTSDDLYVSGYGDQMVYGDLPGDVMILDLVESGRSVNDVLAEIGIGPSKTRVVDGDTINYLTGKQKGLFRSWVLDQGYDGVRYSPLLTTPGKKGTKRSIDEVVVYDVNQANRIVGSKAAVETPSTAAPNPVEIVSKELAADVDNLMEKFPPEVQAEISSGQVSQISQRILDVLADGILAQKNAGKYAAGSFADKIRKAPVGSLTLDAATNFYISSLLWSDATWYAMLLGGVYKSATLPLVRASGFYAQSISDLARLNSAQAIRNMRRGNQQWQMYADYALRLGSSWKLIKLAMETGSPINATMRSMSDYTTPKSLADEQAALRLAGDSETETTLRENTLDNPFFLDPEKNYLNAETFNPLAAATRLIWQANGVSQRIAAAIDTGLSHIVAPASEYRRFFVEELERAEDMGLGFGTKASVEFATRTAQERLDAISRDVYVNGKTVKNGVVVGTAAENVTNWLNFTDDVWITEAEMRLQRTYEGGLREARDRGITNAAEANEFAVAWANQAPNIPAVGRTASIVPKLWENAVNYAPILRLQQAFNRSPANILKSGLRGTPLAGLTDTYWRDINSEIPEIRAQAVGELVVGTTMASILVAMATSGNVQFAGAGPSDPNQNRKWRTYLGLDTGPFSMRVKNPTTGKWWPWVSIQRLDQIAMLGGFIGDYIEIGNSLPQEHMEQLSSGIATSAAVMFRTTTRSLKGQLNRTMFTGFRELVEAIEGLTMPLDVEGDRINPAVAMVENIASKMYPFGGAVRQTKRVVDPRRVSVPASEMPFPFGVLQETFDRMRAQMPGMSNDLPARLHPVTGDELQSAGVWGTQFIPPNMPWLKALVANVSPTSAFPYAESRNELIDGELARLTGRGTLFNFFSPVSIPQHRMTYDEHQAFIRMGTSIELGPNQVTFRDALERLITSPEYQSASGQAPSESLSSDRAAMINNLYKPYQQAAIELFLASDIGRDAKEAMAKTQQGRIDQRNRLTGVTPLEQAQQTRTAAPNPAQFVQELNR